MSIFTRRFYNRLVTFTLGFITVYAFANPDLERIWEFQPPFEQKDYAFLSFYEVDEKNFKQFEKDVKGLTRFLQRRSGYGHTRLVRLENLEGDGHLKKYQYVGIQTWFSPEHMKKALDSVFAQKIISKLRLKSPFNSQMYKIVVDDATYTP